MATVMFALLADRERDPQEAATPEEIVDLLAAHLTAADAGSGSRGAGNSRSRHTGYDS